MTKRHDNLFVYDDDDDDDKTCRSITTTVLHEHLDYTVLAWFYYPTRPGKELVVYVVQVV